MRYLLLATTLLAIAGPGMAATSISGSMSLTARSSLAGGAVFKTVSQSTDSFVGAPQFMSVFALANTTDGQTGGFVTAQGSGFAGVNPGDGNLGIVEFINIGWHYGGDDPSDNGQAASVSDSLGDPDWSYTFQADANGSFKMDYDVVVSFGAGTGGTYALDGWRIGWTGPGGGAFARGTTYDPTNSGSFARSLTAGGIYTVSLRNNAGVSSPGTLATRTDSGGTMDGIFTWAISDVPEPATWAMMIVGFGMVGATLRRRRPALSAAC